MGFQKIRSSLSNAEFLLNNQYRNELILSKNYKGRSILIDTCYRGNVEFLGVLLKYLDYTSNNNIFENIKKYDAKIQTLIHDYLEGPDVKDLGYN